MYKVIFLGVFCLFFSLFEQRTYGQEKKTAPFINSITEGLDMLNPGKKKSPGPSSLSPSTRAVKRQGALDELSPRSLLVLSQAYEQKGEYKKQISVLRQLVQKSQKNGLYWLELARALRNQYFKSGLFKYRDEAMQTIEKIYKMDKKHHESAHLEMLSLLKFKEDSKETAYAILNLLQKLIREYGVKKSYVMDICKYFYINQFHRQSLSGCSKAIKLYPKEASNYIYYALSLKDTEKTGGLLKKAAQQFPNSFFAQVQAGQFSIERKEYSASLSYFKQAVKLDSKSAPAQVGLARSLFHKGQEKIAYRYFLTACMLDKPNMLWAFKQAKSMLNQQGRFSLASVFDKGITKCFLRAPKTAPKT